MPWYTAQEMQCALQRIGVHTPQFVDPYDVLCLTPQVQHVGTCMLSCMELVLVVCMCIQIDQLITLTLRIGRFPYKQVTHLRSPFPRKQQPESRSAPVRVPARILRHPCFMLFYAPMLANSHPSLRHIPYDSYIMYVMSHPCAGLCAKPLTSTSSLPACSAPPRAHSQASTYRYQPPVGRTSAL